VERSFDHGGSVVNGALNSGRPVSERSLHDARAVMNGPLVDRWAMVERSFDHGGSVVNGALNSGRPVRKRSLDDTRAVMNGPLVNRWTVNKRSFDDRWATMNRTFDSSRATNDRSFLPARSMMNRPFRDGWSMHDFSLLRFCATTVCLTTKRGIARLIIWRRRRIKLNVVDGRCRGGLSPRWSA